MLSEVSPDFGDTESKHPAFTESHAAVHKAFRARHRTAITENRSPKTFPYNVQMLSIRPATPDDIPLILAFISELAEYERAPEQAIARPEDLLRDGWGPQPKFRVLIAEWDHAPAGFALFFYNYSTWQGR